MDYDGTTRPKRSSREEWSVVASGDNRIDLLQRVIDVADFSQAARIGTEIAALIQRYERSDHIYDTQVTLRGWRVEITLSAPEGAWWSLSQQELVDTINARFDA
jgi:hypothetical protein